MPINRKHKIGIITAVVLSLAAGTATQTGIVSRHEGVTNPQKGGMVSVAIQQKFDPKGVITVCRGHTNLDDPDLKPGDVYTIAMCDELLKADLPKYNAMLASCLPADFMVGDHQHAAMLSFIYNVGKGNFCNSSVGRAFRAGNREEGCRNMGKFTRANGVVLKGLVNRRYDQLWGEIAWCLRED
jgi:lysozyme